MHAVTHYVLRSVPVSTLIGFAVHMQIASFLAESFLGCAGQVKLPEGYLKAVFE